MSCSSNRHKAAEYENVPHEHNISNDTKTAYNGNCAMNVLQGNCKVKADKTIFHDYKNVRYFFSNEEARNQFIMNIKMNIIKADKIWEVKGGRAADRL